MTIILFGWISIFTGIVYLRPISQWWNISVSSRSSSTVNTVYSCPRIVTFTSPPISCAEVKMPHQSNGVE